MDTPPTWGEKNQRPQRAKSQLPDGFKRQAVALVRSSGKSLTQVAKSLDLTESALRERVRRAQTGCPSSSPSLAADERLELEPLRKENRVLRMERDLLIS